VSGDVEYTGARSARVYPDHWGSPEGGHYSEERVIWCLRHIAADETRADRNTHVALRRLRDALRTSNVRAMNADPERRLRRLERD
jgi:hypothetical protein